MHYLVAALYVGLAVAHIYLAIQHSPQGPPRGPLFSPVHHPLHHHKSVHHPRSRNSHSHRGRTGHKATKQGSVPLPAPYISIAYLHMVSM
jgi:hypothetical protein